MSEEAAERPAGGMEGMVLGEKYELVRLLGQGGMGAVYEGKNRMTLKRNAVKLLLTPELGRNPEVLKRFFREAKASSVIESDHVVTIYDSGVDATTGYPFMVMEYLNGEDIEGTIKRLGAVHPLMATKLVLQAAMGLAKAHEMGITHRDIKPANLFLTQRDAGDLVVKLLDFGIAKVKMENFSETSAGLTRTGSMLGTPLYMSPEQARGASNIDARSDVWSLGVVLYELLCGRLPFEDASSLGELMVSIITADIPLLQDKAPWVAPELAEVTHRAMSRDITKRFQNAGEFRDALAALIPGGNGNLTPAELTGVPEDQRQWVAPRLQLADDGMLRATTRTGLAVTAGGTIQKKSSGGAVAAAVLATLVVAGGGGAAFWRYAKKNQPVAGPATTVTVVQTVQAPAVAPAGPAARTFPLEITPPDAEVWIEGAAATLKEGKVEVTGLPGSTRKVKIAAFGQDKETVVVVTETGLIPDKLKLERRVAGGPAKPGAAAPAGAAAAAPATTKPTAKPKPAVVTNTDEFN